RRPLVFDFALEGTSARDDRPICGGSVRILIDPTAAAQRGAYAAAAEARRERRCGVLVTTVSHRAADCRVATQWFAAGAGASAVGLRDTAEARAALAGETARLFTDGSPEERREVLVEPSRPAPQLVIAGGGHIGQALALQAALVGFEIVILDDRPEFADLALYPEGAAARCGDIAGELAAWPLAPDTYVAIVTRGHQHDERALAACLRRPAAYIGMIGSRRKVALTRRSLLESGAATEEDLARVYAPIGLDIGAETVEEIAAGIVAQLIAVRRRGSAPRMPTAQEPA
ncbi:MAG: XdhC family protein, partial [Planctomycetota bacterium]|nr:XdhC family protein [Planctomycetota bacterium]